jgi:ATP-binding cassette subfamily F protein 3
MGSAVIRASDLTVELGGRNVLDGVGFTVAPGRVLGVVGPNGSGKTTLLRLLAGDLLPDRGDAIVEDASAGYLQQVRPDRPETTVGDAFPHLFAAELLEPSLTAAAEELATVTGDAAADAGARYDELLARLGSLAAPEVVEDARDALGLRAVSVAEPLSALSGGELAKLGLLDLVAAQPDALLLDEPTNHLDLDGLDWLDRYLDGFAGPIVAVSHDRALLDDHADQLLVLAEAGAKPELFTGNYSAWLEEQERRREEQWAQYERQRKEERRIRRAIQSAESRARGIEQRTIDFHYRKRALKVARQAVTLKSRLQREHERGDRVERPDKIVEGLRGQFGDAERSATRLLEVSDLRLAVAGRELLHDASFVLERGDRTVLMGANGSGKTSLLRAVTGDLEGIEVGGGRIDLAASARIGWLPQDDRALLPDDPELSAVDFLRSAREMSEAEAYDHLHQFLFAHDAARSRVATLSPGELRRLALARLVLGGANLLLLDEPTNHLDLPAREAFEATLDGYEGATLIVTHDRYFIERFATEVLMLEEGRLRALASGSSEITS